MNRREGLTVAAAGVALTLAGYLGWTSTAEMRTLLAVNRVHEAAAAGDWARVVEASEALVAAPDAQGEVLPALEARCRALMTLGRSEDCFALLDRRLFAPTDSAWVPVPVLTPWFDRALAQGRTADAAMIAERLRRSKPSELRYAAVAFDLRVRAEGADAALVDAPAWLAEMSPADEPKLALVMAGVLYSNGARAEAAPLLRGRVAPPEPEVATSWWRMRMATAAAAGDPAEVREVADAWLAAGGPPAEIQARYATLLSQNSIRDPNQDWVQLLEAVLPIIDEVRHPDLERLVYVRLVGQLHVDGAAVRALEVLREARARFPDFAMSEAELTRVAALAQDGPGGAASSAGALVFSVRAPVNDAQLWVSPDGTAANEAAWEAIALSAQGQARAVRVNTATPVRWVYRSETQTFASGSAWPASGRPVEVAVEPRAPTARQAAAAIAPRPERDGRRGIWVVVLDCGDWRLVNYLRQRGELPVIDKLLAEGWRAGMAQQPAFTAAAMDALMNPATRRSASFVDGVHQLGLELAGLESIGTNPFAALGAVLPQQASLDLALAGAGDRVGNMLFSHGAVQAGRNAAITLPGGGYDSLSLGPHRRPLTAEEIQHLPALAAGGPVAEQAGDKLEGTASQFDAVVRIVKNHEVDTLLFRAEALDLVSHARYAETATGAQDDGAPALYQFYRYLDLRLGHLVAAMDGDDALIVMSDHGIKVSMEHDPVAMFVAWGSGVPRGRTLGRPALRGVGRVLADMRGIPVAWPDEGLGPWAGGWRVGEAVAPPPEAPAPEVAP